MDNCPEHLDLCLHTPEDSDKRVWHFNVAFIGSCRVGKSKLLLRFVDSEFSDIYSETAETRFVSKSVSIGRHHVVFQCWDTPGSSRAAGCLDSRLTQLHAIFIVFDVSRDAVADLEHWYHLAFAASTTAVGSPPPLLVLVANKTDLGRHDGSLARARQLASMAPGGGLVFALSVRTDEENLEVDAMMLEVGKALTERHTRETAAADAAAAPAASVEALMTGDGSKLPETPTTSRLQSQSSALPPQPPPLPLPPQQVVRSQPTMTGTAGDDISSKTTESDRTSIGAVDAAKGFDKAEDMSKNAKAADKKATCWERACCCLGL